MTLHFAGSYSREGRSVLKSNEEKSVDTEESKEDTVEVGPELEIPSVHYAAKIQKAIDRSRKKQKYGRK